MAFHDVLRDNPDILTAALPPGVELYYDIRDRTYRFAYRGREFAVNREVLYRVSTGDALAMLVDSVHDMMRRADVEERRQRANDPQNGNWAVETWSRLERPAPDQRIARDAAQAPATEARKPEPASLPALAYEGRRRIILRRKEDA